MKVLGMAARSAGEAEDGIKTDAAQATGSAQAGAFDEVLSDLQAFDFGQVAAKEGRTGSFGEVMATGGAAQAANVLGCAGPAVGAKVVVTPLAVGRTVGVRTGEDRSIPLTHSLLSSGQLTLTF